MANDATFESLFDALKQAAQKNVQFKVDICKVIEASQEAVKAEYEEVRRKAKKAFMVDEKGLLDRHKCAAAFMIAILKGLDTSSVDGNPSVRKTVREHLSLTAGQIILVNMIDDDYENPQNTQVVDYWRANNYAIRYPETLKGTGKYIDNWAVELYHARKNDLLFVLALAHEIFCLETYNRQLAKIEELKKAVFTLKQNALKQPQTPAAAPPSP